ncbi:helix-turn-helix transcriptional regulator [Streptomyces gardneri]|uniref:LuxR C-terminal-related transcriptional regulator n=1 Tax=Nocardia TaxID=1817 RepID=UPI00135C7974|nr:MULTISPECIES: LuxR C-terminal-related transcriptional regulator [Nocardia]MBF6164094.1 helix-turn-helix transcriptional regulator [Streptomyces gardneri]MBF6203669.1 helix-turn-helix transcriptional regulator [Streptomyces gardneri]
MADTAFDTLPSARDIFRDLESADDQPVVYLIRGRSQTGKSTLLAEIRARLRARGVPLQDDTAAVQHAHAHNGSHPLTRTPASVAGATAGVTTDTARPALIIDNAHTLGGLDLEYLRAAVEAGRRTMVIAAQPRPHDPRLRLLADAVARRGRVVDLRPLGVADMAPFARELGMMVPRQVAQHIHVQTAGIRGGVVAALTAACSARLDAGIAAVDTAVAAWARGLLDNLEPDLLETLVVATTGTGLDSSELTEVLGVEPAVAQDLIDRARASALVTDADLLIEPAVAPLRTLLGDRRFVAVERRLLGARLEAGLLRDRTALQLAESGVRDPRLADFLVDAAERTGREAVRYYAAAAAAGAELDLIALRWAEAAARTGDGDTAMRLAEPMLARSGSSGTELATAVRICAAVLTRRGLVGRAAQLYTWLGADRVGPDWAIGATVLRLAGDVAGAEEMASSATQWPPTEAHAHARLIATALADSIAPGNSTASAVSALVQAANADAGVDRFLPCTAASIAALLSLGTGEPRRAQDALRRATASGLRCHQLDVLAAWTAMLGGDERAAAATVAALDYDRLDVRDRLLAHGVAVGLARRSGDHASLARAWQAAYPLFDDVQADLLALLPIGELWLAAIRMRDERRIEPLVEAALTLLRRLNEPPAWSNAFHWYGVQAAIAHESPDDLLPHARALKAAAEAGDRHAAVLADAGRTWVLVLRGQVATAPVHAAVAALTEIGMTWDGARLASEAALAAPDSATATALLKLARTVRADARPQEPQTRPAAPAATDGDTPAPPPTPPQAAILSEREREVAELVLLGLTYREIGARLYISAKTVEHHVARIRRRVGARSRSELLSMLRAMGHGSLLV